MIFQVLKDVENNSEWFSMCFKTRKIMFVQPLRKLIFHTNSSFWQVDV